MRVARSSESRAMPIRRAFNTNMLPAQFQPIISVVPW